MNAATYRLVCTATRPVVVQWQAVAQVGLFGDLEPCAGQAPERVKPGDVRVVAGEGERDRLLATGYWALALC